VAPTLISPSPYIVHDTGANTTALTTASFTPSVGEVIVAKASTWDWSTNFGTGPTGGGLTWTKRVESLGTGSGGAYSVIWTAVVGGSPTSMTVSMTPTGSSRHSMVVERWSGAQLAATTAYSVTTGSLTTDVGMLLVGTALNDNVTASGESLSQTGATLTGLAERSDTGSATGNDVAIQSYTATVTTGATATLTLAATLSGASEGGSVVVAQTSTAAATSAVLWPRRRGPNYRR
jgi:hypothetical protein